jgi:CO/xanthine dehydrogenase Mo-binding subunit
MGIGTSGAIDGPDRVTGRLAFVQDVAPRGVLETVIVRSQEPHARLTRVDTTRAARMAGVAVAVGGSELVRRFGRPIAFGPVYRDQPALAWDKVRYVGEPVAAVAATDLDIAREAADLIEVEYEPLPPVLDLDAALDADAALVHEEERPAGTHGFSSGPAGSNVCSTFRLRKGSVEAGFAEADLVVEDWYETPAVQHVPLEPHASVADARGGRLTVWTGTQTPYGVRLQLAELFDVPASRVRVIVPAIGGAFGGKGHAKLEPLAALLSWLAGRPVRIRLDRSEEFVTLTKHAARIRMRTGVCQDGRITAREVESWFDTGAYADIGPRVASYGGVGMGGPYAIDHVAVDARAIYTNRPPAGAFRGFGFPQATWAHERQMDTIADRLGIDPLELRLRNVITDGQTYSTGEVFEDCRFRELLEAGARAIGWDATRRASRNGSRVRAHGIAVGVKATIVPSISTAIVKLGDDGSLDLLASSVDMGQGVRTSLARIAADALALPIERINVAGVDTDTTPYDQMTSASRSTFTAGAAVRQAAESVKGQLADAAAELLEASPTDLEFVDGAVRVRGVPSRAIPYGAVIRRSRLGNLIGEGRDQHLGGLDPETGQGVGSVHWTPGVGAAEVEVDLETGKVDVLRYHAGTYAGRVVDEDGARLQVDGCVTFGVGQALFEQLIFDGGQLTNGSLADYLIASARDLPARMTAMILEDAEPHEVHGMGEACLPPVMPAIANAVARATGLALTRLPVTPELVLRGLREAVQP